MHERLLGYFFLFLFLVLSVFLGLVLCFFLFVFLGSFFLFCLIFLRFIFFGGFFRARIAKTVGYGLLLIFRGLLRVEHTVQLVE